MNRSAVQRAWILVAAAFAAGTAWAQGDPAFYRTRSEAAAKQTAQLQEAAKARVAAVRKAINDPDNKVHGDLDGIDGKVGGLEFAGALGALDLADDHLEYVAEAARPAVKAANVALRKVLKDGEQAKAQQDYLQEIGDRLEHLQRLVQEQSDIAAPLRDLDESMVHAQKWSALTKGELAALRVHLAGHRTSVAKKLTDELRERAGTELTQLEQAFSAMAKGFAAQGNEKDSAFAQFDQAQASLVDALVQLPEGDAATKALWARFQKLDTTAREGFTKAYGGSILERVKSVFENERDEFGGWPEEHGTVTAEEYLKIDCTVNLLANPRTAAMVNRGNLWLAFAGSDAEFQRAAQHEKLKALHDSVQKDRDTAVARLIPVATALVADVEKTGLGDEVQRNRATVLADWDLRVALQEHPNQWELIARVHKLVDAFDRKALGDEPALEKLRDEARKAAEANWSRMLKNLPLTGGFVAQQAGKFQGKLTRLDAGRNHAGDFAPGDFDLVFRIEGQLFAARYDPAVKAAVQAAAARTRIPLTEQDEYEVVVMVGAEGTLTVPAPDGKGQGATVPCRQMRIVGIRLGAIAFLAR